MKYSAICSTALIVLFVVDKQFYHSEYFNVLTSKVSVVAGVFGLYW
jgi:hypothetical protein